MDFVYDEISEALGEEAGYFDAAEFEENMSTHYGRMIHVDDRTIMFANPEDAAEYLGFDLDRASDKRPGRTTVYEKNGEKYFVVDSHMHFWDASPDNWVPGAGAVRQGLDRVLPRLPGPGAGGDPLDDRAVPEVLRGRPDEGRLRGRATSTSRSSSRRT